MKLLLIEDDEKLCELLLFQLEKEKHEVDVCHDGRDGLDFFLQDAYDLVLLDRMLPTMNGLLVLKKARSAGITTPVILITALGELYDRIEGLDSGADDYIVKPFEFEELLARIRCVTRRSLMLSGQADGRLTYHDISWAVRDMCLSGPSGTCTLSKHEGDLLEAFLHTPGQTLARDTLLLKVWGPDSDVETGNLDNYIHFLRRRLKSVESTLQIKTVRGVGYGLFIS